MSVADAINFLKAEESRFSKQYGNWRKVDEISQHIENYKTQYAPKISPNIASLAPLFIVDMQGTFERAYDVENNVLGAVRRSKQESRQIIRIECDLNDPKAIDPISDAIIEEIGDYPFESFFTKAIGVGDWQIKAHFIAYYEQVRTIMMTGGHYHSCLRWATEAVKDRGIQPILVDDCIYKHKKGEIIKESYATMISSF